MLQDMPLHREGRGIGYRLMCTQYAHTFACSFTLSFIDEFACSAVYLRHPKREGVTEHTEQRAWELMHFSTVAIIVASEFQLPSCTTVQSDCNRVSHYSSHGFTP